MGGLERARHFFSAGFAAVVFFGADLPQWFPLEPQYSEKGSRNPRGEGLRDKIARSGVRVGYDAYLLPLLYRCRSGGTPLPASAGSRGKAATVPTSAMAQPIRMSFIRSISKSPIASALTPWVLSSVRS